MSRRKKKHDERLAVEGRLRDEHGHPVEGGMLSVSSPDRLVIEIGIVSGSKGRFELPPLVAGRYVVEAVAGKRRGRVAFDVRHEGPNVIEVVVVPSEVERQTKMAKGESKLEDADVVAAEDGSDGTSPVAAAGDPAADPLSALTPLVESGSDGTAPAVAPATTTTTTTTTPTSAAVLQGAPDGITLNVPLQITVRLGRPGG